MRREYKVSHGSHHLTGLCKVHPPLRARTKCRTEPPVTLYSDAVLSSFICLPLKMSLCCAGGIPSFSSTRSLILSTLSVGSISISISLPVSVLTLINILVRLSVAQGIGHEDGL